MNANDTAAYAGALTRFLSATGLAAPELAELAEVDAGTMLNAVAGVALPTAYERWRIAGEVNAIKLERGLA
jgi:hypothetical protein